MEEWASAYSPFSNYKISNKGRVLTPMGKIAKRQLSRGMRNVTVYALDSETMLSSSLNIRKAVATAFVEGYDSNIHGIRHKDGDSLNCDINNLEIFLKAEEVEDKRFPSKQMIIADLDNGLTKVDIQDKYSVSATALNNLMERYCMLESLINHKCNDKAYTTCYSYIEEAPEFIQYLLRNLNLISKTSVCLKYGMPQGTLNHWLRKLGFPSSVRELSKLKSQHELNGTLDSFYSAKCNIRMLPMGEGEIMKPIEGHPCYFITSHGRILSHKKFTTWTELAPTITDKRSPIIKLSNVSTNTYSVRTLVAKAFVPNPDPVNLTHCLSINGDLTNCRADNIKWVTECEFNAVLYIYRKKGGIA